MKRYSGSVISTNHVTNRTVRIAVNGISGKGLHKIITHQLGIASTNEVDKIAPYLDEVASVDSGTLMQATLKGLNVQVIVTCWT